MDVHSCISKCCLFYHSFHVPGPYKKWLGRLTQDAINDWAETKSSRTVREIWNLLSAALGGIGAELGVWNSTDIMGLNSRIYTLGDGTGHAMEVRGVIHSLIIDYQEDDTDIHDIAHNLSSNGRNSGCHLRIFSIVSKPQSGDRFMLHD